MILVTGANGNFGKATINFLLNKGIPPENIAGMVRNQVKAADLERRKVIVRTGDYNDYGSLVNAFKGADKLLLVSGSEIVNRSLQHENAVNAAKKAGVKHIIYTSFERKNESKTSPIYAVAESHLHTEKMIKKSGIPFTILRNNLYMDSLPMFLGEKVLETGIFFPAGDTGATFVLRNDMAEATSNVLSVLSGNEHEYKVYYISHTETVSFHEIARILSEIAGNKISYTSPDVKTFSDTLKKAGVPDMFTGILASFAEGINQGEFLPGKSDLEPLLGRKPVTVSEFLKRAYGSGD